MLVVALGCFGLGCAGNDPLVVSPDAERTPTPPSPAEEKKDFSSENLRVGTVSSHHYVWLRGAEKPHVHDRTDLTVFVLRGEVLIHFEDRAVIVRPGQVVDIPMGAFHWAENASRDPGLAYIVYSPAFDGTDRRFVQPSPQPSAKPSP